MQKDLGHVGKALRMAGAVLLVIGILAPFVQVQAQDATRAPVAREDLQDVARSYQVFENRDKGVEGLQAELTAVAARRRALQSEQAYIETKVEWAKRQLAGTEAGGAPEGEDKAKLTQELKQWESRLAAQQQALALVTSEEEAMMKALSEIVRSQTESDMLIPGETVEVYVAEDDSFNGLYQVRAGGYIVLPRLPRIFVAGKTLKQVEAAIRNELARDQVRDATVTVDRVQGPPEVSRETRHYIYLVGQVSNPGVWPVPGGYQPTITTVLLRVGTTFYADLERVQILRLIEGRGLIEEVNVRQIMEGEGLTPDFALQPYDIVIVPARETGEIGSRGRQESHRIHIQGNFVNPGIVNLVAPARMTVLAAMRHSGGPNRNADLSKLELIRIERDRTRREILDLGAIMRGEMPDVDLMAEDILVLYGLDERHLIGPIRVYLTGTVRKTGPVEIEGKDGELTLMQALLHNGGFARFADLKDVYVLRDMGNGIRNRIPVNLKKVQKGIIPDLLMKDNDMVVVPEKFFSF